MKWLHLHTNQISPLNNPSNETHTDSPPHTHTYTHTKTHTHTQHKHTHPHTHTHITIQRAAFCFLLCPPDHNLHVWLRRRPLVSPSTNIISPPITGQLARNCTNHMLSESPSRSQTLASAKVSVGGR